MSAHHRPPGVLYLGNGQIGKKTKKMGSENALKGLTHHAVNEPRKRPMHLYALDLGLIPRGRVMHMRYHDWAKWLPLPGDSMMPCRMPWDEPWFQLNIRGFRPYRSRFYWHWKSRVAMMQTLSSLAAPEVVIKTTSGAASDDKVGIMATLGFLYNEVNSLVPGIWGINFKSIISNNH